MIGEIMKNMKIQFSQSSYEDTERNSLLDDIAKTKFALEIAYSGFDNVTDPDLIDSYIYQVNSILKRYRYLLGEAAKMDLLPKSNLCQEPSVASLAR